MQEFTTAMTNTYLPDIMHGIAQGLLIPTMVALIALLVVTVFFVGQVILEAFTERWHYKQNLPQIVNEVNDATYDTISDVICNSQLLRFQKAALMTCSRNMGLPDDALFALAQIEIGKAEKHYKFRLAWTDTISKIGPLLGLMGTLIPLGPGMVALGKNDVSTLSSSLLLAFDATVCGLVCAIIALIISKIRSGWYTSYINTLESIMSVIVERAAEARAAGVNLPKGYAGDVMKEFKQGGRAGGGAGSIASGSAQSQGAHSVAAAPFAIVVEARVKDADEAGAKPEGGKKPVEGKHDKTADRDKESAGGVHARSAASDVKPVEGKDAEPGGKGGK